MKNKTVNKISEPIDFKGFYLFNYLCIQKINEVLKDRKFANQFSQQPVDQFTQQAVAQLRSFNSLRFLELQNALMESLVFLAWQLNLDAERQLNQEKK